MSINIDNNFVTNFGDTFELVSQQQMSKLRSCAREKKIVGEAMTIEKLFNPNDTLAPVNSRHADLEISDMSHSRRISYVHDYARGYMIDTEDKVRMLIDPTSSYIEEITGEYNRTIDDALIEALLGSSYNGKTGSTVTALPAAQAIAHGSAGLTLAKVKQAYKILLKGHVDPDREDLILVVNAEGYEDLMNDAGLINIQNVPFRPNYDAKVPQVAGFKVLCCERLNNYVGAGAGTTASSSNRPAIAFASSALRLGTANFEKAITKETLKSLNWVIAMKTSFAVARSHDEKVVDIRFQEQ